MTPEVLPALQWWAQLSHLLQGVPLLTPLPELQLYRRLDRGMGNPSDHSPDFRLMTHFIESSSHQQPRTDSRTPHSTTLPASGA